MGEDLRLEDTFALATPVATGSATPVATTDGTDYPTFSYNLCVSKK